eukprot:522045_1
MQAFLVIWLSSLSCLLTHGDTIPVACSKNFNSYPFCDTTLSLNDRVHSLISLLTLEEKATLLTARESPLNFIPRLGIPEYDWGTNCIHSAQSRCGSACSTVFPEPNALGASFNKTLISNISLAIGLELRALWLQGLGEDHNSNLPHLGLNCWSPTINIGRDPRWGRMYEIPSEDPYWNGVYGKYYTLGLQNGSKDSTYYDKRYYLAVVTLKHFDAYSLENYGNATRHNFNAIVSPYMFQDTYLPAWKKSVVEGGAKGVMCSYNAVNGIPTCASSFLLNTTLRQEWGFEGYVTSDSGAINDIWAHHHYTDTLPEAVVVALNATCDMDSWLGTSMGGIASDYGTSSPYQKYAVELVKNGTLSESLVDQALFNTLRLRFELGLFDGNYDDQPYFNVPGSVVNSQSHKDLNLFAARSTQTLLKNDGNMLPFSIDTNKKFAILGPHYNASADLLLENAYTGQVCYDSTFDCVPGILQALANVVSANALSYASGCDDVKCSSKSGFADAIASAQAADYVVLMMGIDLSIERESHDRTNISLPGYQQDLAHEVCKIGKPTVLVLVGGGVLAIDELKEECPSILYAWYPGFRGAEAIVDVLFGKHNPGGKMAVTMYWSNYTQESDYLEMDLSKGNGKTYKYWKGTTPLFPFGYGLSYTKFTLKMDGTCKQPQYCIEITNIGDRAGYETVFVFVYPPTTLPSSEPASKMIKHLIEFDKFYLENGKSSTFKFTLDKSSDLVLYDSNGDAKIFSGYYKLEFTNGVDQNVSFTVSI